MSETFFIKNTNFDDFSNDITLRESTSFVIGPGELDGPNGRTRNSDLELYGFGALKWGEGVNQNLFRMLENNTCPEKTLGDFLPGTDDPLTFDPTDVIGTPPIPQGSYDPLIHPILPKDEFDLGLGNGITVPIIGQTWFNISDEELYMFGTAGWTPIIATATIDLNTHIADDTVHLTPPQNTFLDDLALTGSPPLTAAEVNTLNGIDLILGGGTVQGQLDLMVEKAGDTMTGNLTMNSSLPGSGQVLFKSGEHRINTDDSGGDFNIRIGHTFNSFSSSDIYSANDSGAVLLTATQTDGTGSPPPLPSFKIKVGENPSGKATNEAVIFTGTTTFNSDGNVSVSAAVPTENPHLARKDYVDTEIANNLAFVLNAVYPLGSIFITFDSNPANLPPIGTWAVTLEGRFLVGAGTSDKPFAGGSSGGASEHTLNVSELPSHNHGGGVHRHTIFMGGGSSGPRKAIAIDTSNNGSHGYIGNYQATQNSSAILTPEGGNQPHNNLPPYQTTYVFTRTA